MKSASYLIMWLGIFLLLILVLLIGLVLLLLAGLYCPALIHRRRRQVTTAIAADTTTATENTSRRSPSAPESHATHAADSLNDDIEKQLLESPSSDSVNGSASLVYISNPIYGEENGTPFETPGSSPSRLETEDSSGDDEIGELATKGVVTPPLTPMKKLSSVCLKDVGSLGSDTNSNNGVSSSCSLTPYTSPSIHCE